MSGAAWPVLLVLFCVGLPAPAQPHTGPAQSGTAAAQAPASQPPSPAAQRPNVLDRPWTDDAASPHGRAQAVAAERFQPVPPSGPSPYPDRFRSPVPTPFRPDAQLPHGPVAGWNWDSGGYPTLLAPPRSPTGAGLWVLFPAPWMTQDASSGGRDGSTLPGHARRAKGGRAARRR